MITERQTPLEQAIVLRVRRDLTRVTFPWDCVYFFRKEAENLLPRVFPCSLVLELSAYLVDRLRTLLSYGEGEGKIFPQWRGKEKELLKQTTQRKPIQYIIDTPDSFVALIPILHLKGWRQKGETGPVYLTAHTKTANNTGSFKLFQKTVDHGSYFLYHSKKIRPPCLCCSHSLDHLRGKCSFGGETCYDALSKVRKSDFVTALAEYKRHYDQLANLNPDTETQKP